MNVFAAFSRIYTDWTSAKSLSELDACRLSDLGLTRYDLFDARFKRGTSRGDFLAARRDSRAETWLR